MTLYRKNGLRNFSIQDPTVGKKLQTGEVLAFSGTNNIKYTLFPGGIIGSDLVPTGVIAGTYGSSTMVPVITVDIFGRITIITEVPVSGGGGGISLETNGTPNPVQTLLNLVAGTNMTITDDGLGNITFAAAGGGGGSGTVTSVGAGTGMNFTTITTSGNIAIDTSKVPYLASGFTTGLLKWNGSAWVFDNSAYITASALAGYVQDTRAVNTAKSLTGGGNLSADRTIELVGDETTPAANKYYGTDGSGNRGYHLLNQVPVPYIYIRKVYQLVGTYLTSMVYHPSLLFFSSFFLGGGTGGTQIYDATTAEFDSTSTFTQALHNRKVTNGVTDEVWTISQSQPTIQRLNASTGAFIANSILTGVIATAINTRFCQFSSTKVFLANATNYFVLNPATFVTTSLTAHVLGNIPHVAVNNNPSSPQNGTVMMGGPNGIILIDGATNAITVPATTLSGAIGPIYDIQYDATNDVWVVVTAVGVTNNPMKIVYIKPNTATTFTVPTTVYGISLMGSPVAAGAAIYARLLIDETNDYLFLFFNHRLTQIRLTTGDIIQSIPIQSISPDLVSGAFSAADIDLTNKRIFAASGLNTGAGQWTVNEIMYS
jgi:hypothetical protein